MSRNPPVLFDIYLTVLKVLIRRGGERGGGGEMKLEGWIGHACYLSDTSRSFSSSNIYIHIIEHTCVRLYQVIQMQDRINIMGK